MMHPHVFRWLWAAALIPALGFSGALAQEAAEAQQPGVEYAQASPLGKPLMIIRFNQQYVHYRNSLTLAVLKAREAKSTVRFNVISYVPPELIKSSRVEDNLKTVAADIRNMGILPSRVSTGVQVAPELSTQEIHIFVE